MGLARARPADEDDVVRLVGKRQIGQCCDELALNARLPEVETRQIPMKGF